MGGTIVRMALRRGLRRYGTSLRSAPARRPTGPPRVHTGRAGFRHDRPADRPALARTGTLAASWLMLREALLVPGFVDRATKEAVAAAVSVGNTCPYCVAVHVPRCTACSRTRRRRTSRPDRVEEITDPTLRGIVAWRGPAASSTPRDSTTCPSRSNRRRN